jgi:hypothetical protein
MPEDDAFCQIIILWRGGRGDAVLDMPELWITATTYVNYLMLPRGTRIGSGDDEFKAIGNSFASVKAFQAACTFYFGRIKMPSPLDHPGEHKTISTVSFPYFTCIFDRHHQADRKLA